MKNELNVGDLIEFEGVSYKIVKFHKGIGSSEITATLQDENGKQRDVLKRILVGYLEEKETFSRKQQRIENRVKFEDDIEIAEIQKRIRKKKEKKNGLS
jgi:hypothetical protein